MRHSFVRTSFVLALALAIGLTARMAAAAGSKPDPWITAKVKIFLLTAEDVDALDVNVDTVNGRVTLHGTVDSEAEKARAGEVARQIEGVADVRNLLQVVPGEKAQEAQAHSDDEVRKAVETLLDRDQALEDSDIRVASVHNGVVVLSGEAKTLSDHQRALEDTRAVEGVRHVASQVRSPDSLSDAELWREGKMQQGEPGGTLAGVADMWITTQAKVKLLADEATPGMDINVDTRDGVVTLFGTLTSDEAKSQAERIVKEIEGVKYVENEIQMVAASQLEQAKRSDEQIRTAAKERLAARQDLADADIDVAVADGVARLTGSVVSQSDRLSALTAVGDVHGVRSVFDDLKVSGDVAAPPPRSDETDVPGE